MLVDVDVLGQVDAGDGVQLGLALDELVVAVPVDVAQRRTFDPAGQFHLGAALQGAGRVGESLADRWRGWRAGGRTDGRARIGKNWQRCR